MESDTDLDVFEGLPPIFRQLTDGVRRGIDLSAPWRYKEHVYTADGYAMVRCPVEAVEWHILKAIRRTKSSSNPIWYADRWKEETPDLYHDDPIRIAEVADVAGTHWLTTERCIGGRYASFLMESGASIFLPRFRYSDLIRFTADDADGFVESWWQIHPPSLLTRNFWYF